MLEEIRAGNVALVIIKDQSHIVIPMEQEEERRLQKEQSTQVELSEQRATA